MVLISLSLLSSAFPVCEKGNCCYHIMFLQKGKYVWSLVQAMEAQWKQLVPTEHLAGMQLHQTSYMWDRNWIKERVAFHCKPELWLGFFNWVEYNFQVGSFKPSCFVYFVRFPWGTDFPSFAMYCFPHWWEVHLFLPYHLAGEQFNHSSYNRGLCVKKPVIVFHCKTPG